jgi:glycogen(starch) synthase
MRILHLSWEYPPVMYGGLGRHVHALAENQVARGDEVVVITQAASGHASDEVVNGVRVIRVARDAPDVSDWRDRFIEWTFGFNIAVARAGIALARDWRPDVVHGHDWLVAQAAVLVQEAARVPFVLTVHATESGRQGGLLTTDLARDIDSTEDWGVRHADAVIVCSDYMRDEVATLFGRAAEGIAVIPNGIDAAEWRTTDSRRRTMRRRYGSPLIVFAGRLEVEKGVQTLIDAMPGLRRSVPGVRAVIIGEGGAKADLRARARRRRLGDAVTFLGHVSETDLRALISAADVAVVPSLYEPFGFVALEATVLGAPLVVAGTGGLATIVDDGHTGWHFKPGDANALSDALAEALCDRREARRRATRARADVLTRYGWPTIAAQTDAVYRGVTHEGPAGRAAPP